MRQIFPLGDYVRRTGDIMTGPLTIKRDTTNPLDPHLILQSNTAAGDRAPLAYKNYAGTIKGLILFYSSGTISISPDNPYDVNIPWIDLGWPVNWRPYGFPAGIHPRRVMMVESRLFGRR